MKRLWLIAILLGLASNVSAVEVTVKTDTKLYDNKGKVIREVTAGFPFKADKANGEWVYGFLRTRGGGVRGWIPIAALDLDDEARSKLGVPITTRPDGTKVEPVLLRCRLAPGDLQVYETALRLNLKMSGRDEVGKTSEMAMGIALRLDSSVTGKGSEPDGTILAEFRFYDFDMEIDGVRDGARVQIKANPEGAAAYLNGSLIASGPWDSPKLKDMPNFAQLLTTTAKARLDERGRILDMGHLGALDDEMGAFDAKRLFGSDMVFPDEPIGPGDCWEHDVSQPIDIHDPAHPGTSVTLSGKVKYTVLERTTYAKRPCLKISILAAMKSGRAAGQLNVSQTIEGVSYIEEATGIQLHTKVTLGQAIGGSIQGTSLTGSTAATVTLNYKGSKLE